MARNLAVETYVPGHGPAHLGRGMKDLEEQKRYFVVMRDEVAKMIAAGKNLEQIEKEFKIPQEFAHYTRPERLPKGWNGYPLRKSYVFPTEFLGIPHSRNRGQAGGSES